MKRVSTAWACLGLAGALLVGCGTGGTSEGNGLPGAPLDVVAQAADAQALVTWSPPETDGGSAILYYVVRCDPACGGAIVNERDRQATVLGLNNGMPYAFQVVAVNARGESPGSVPSVLVTPLAGAAIPDPTVPGQPRSVRATPGNGVAYVSWLAPASFGGRPLTGYRVTVEPGGATVTVPASEAMARIEGLANGTFHGFKVVAINEAGEGPAAHVAPVMPRSGGVPASWVSGYYVGYQRGLYPVDSVDFSGMTHVVVGRVRPRFDGTLYTNFDVSDHEGPAMARALAERAHAAGRKALLMLGGFSEREGFVEASSPQRRAIFVRSLLKTMDELGYDGLDVDWEPILLPPAGNDGELLLALLDDLRAARPGILLTVPVGWLNSNFEMTEAEATFMRNLSARVDQLNIMSYKMSGNWWGWESWHSSPLYDDALNRPTSIDHSVQGFLAAGVPPGRLGIGIGFFGMCLRGVTEPRTPLDEREISEGESDNTMSYSNIMRAYYDARARRWDDVAKVPYLSLPSAHGPERCNYISYEDGQSITAKGQYLRARGLGGSIIWTINQGHLPDQPEGQRDPLLQAVKSAFLDP